MEIVSVGHDIDFNVYITRGAASVAILGRLFVVSDGSLRINVGIDFKQVGLRHKQKCSLWAGCGQEILGNLSNGIISRQMS